MNNITNPTSTADLPSDVYSTGLESGKSSMRDRIDSARMRFDEMYEGARDKVTAGCRTTDDAVHTHPYYAMGMALGLGVLVGVLISRRSDSNYIR